MSAVELQKLQDIDPSLTPDSHKAGSYTTITLRGYCYGDGSRDGVT